MSGAACAPLRVLDERGPAAPSGVSTPGVLLDVSHGEAESGAIRCRVCGHPVTTASARVAVAGAHEHDRMNPAGFVYRIGCFRPAPGCVSVGAPSAEFAWFPGCAWRIALCRGCFAHLGWAFEGAEPAFHGLILDRLAEDADGRTSR